jgi:hypothetical protein
MPDSQSSQTDKIYYSPQYKFNKNGMYLSGAGMIVGGIACMIAKKPLLRLFYMSTSAASSISYCWFLDKHSMLMSDYVYSKFPCTTTKTDTQTEAVNKPDVTVKSVMTEKQVANNNSTNLPDGFISTECGKYRCPHGVAVTEFGNMCYDGPRDESTGHIM